jgi:hypothetical protein
MDALELAHVEGSDLVERAPTIVWRLAVVERKKRIGRQRDDWESGVKLGRVATGEAVPCMATDSAPCAASGQNVDRAANGGYGASVRADAVDTLDHMLRDITGTGCGFRIVVAYRATRNKVLEA